MVFSVSERVSGEVDAYSKKNLRQESNESKSRKEVPHTIVHRPS